VDRFLVEIAGGPRRVDTGPVEGLGGLDVPQAREAALVEEQDLDRTGGAREGAPQIRGPERAVERFGPQVAESGKGVESDSRRCTWIFPKTRLSRKTTRSPSRRKRSTRDQRGRGAPRGARSILPAMPR
jgi:hypothetical protein